MTAGRGLIKKNMIVTKIGNIEIKLNDTNGDLFIKNETGIVKVPSDDVDNFIQCLIDEVW